MIGLASRKLTAEEVPDTFEGAPPARGVCNIKLGRSAAKPKSWGIMGILFLSADFSHSAVSESTGVSLSDCNFPVSGFDLLGFFAIEAAASVTRANARREPSIISWLHPQTANLLTEESS